MVSVLSEVRWRVIGPSGGSASGSISNGRSSSERKSIAGVWLWVVVVVIVWVSRRVFLLLLLLGI